MMEMRNGRTKRMLSALADEGTLSVFRAMRAGGWHSLGELCLATGFREDGLSPLLSELVDLGVIARREGSPSLFRLSEPCIRLELDLREVPPGPGYILDVVRFYIRFISNIMDRCREVGGAPVQEEAWRAVAEAQASLPRRERALLGCLRPGIDVEECLRNLERRIMEGELGERDLPWVRDTYLRVVCHLAGRLEGRLDDSLLKLLFRLAARELLQEGFDLPSRFGLLDGFPEKYLKQVEAG